MQRKMEVSSRPKLASALRSFSVLYLFKFTSTYERVSDS